MLYRSINVAILILLAWFSFVSVQATKTQSQAIYDTRLQLAKSHQLLAEKQAEADEQRAAFQSSLETFLATQQSQSNEKKKLESAISAQKRVTGLHQLYGKVLKADALRSGGKSAEAASLLKSTKKEIWQTGDRYPKHQKALRASMQTIDGLVKAWTAKDTSKSAAPVYQALEKVLSDSKGK